MTLYAVSLTSSVVSASHPSDVFEITASTRSNLRLHGMILSRVSTAGVGTTSVDHPLVEVLRGSSANGGTATGTAINLDSLSRATASFLVNLVTSAIGSAGSTVAELLSASMNSVGGTFVWYPECKPTCKLGERLSIRIGPRANAMVLTGTVYVEETGKMPGLGDR